MGKIREGGNAGRVKNLDHLAELCKMLADPDISVKSLNTLYAIRTAWQSRGYLLERELLIVRTDNNGEYRSRAQVRQAKAESIEPVVKQVVVKQEKK